MAATALRRLFVNLDEKRLQISDRNGGAFTLPNFNKYETVPLEIVIVQADLGSAGLNRFSRADISPLSLSISINQTFDSATPLAQQTFWSKDETTNTFSGELALNTASMNTYIGANDSKQAYFEIEIQEGTARSKIFTALVTLQNAVTQVTSTSPAPADEYYTKSQTVAQFVGKIMGAGETITITSPGGIYQRIIGVDDGGAPIDQIVPV